MKAFSERVATLSLPPIARTVAARGARLMRASSGESNENEGQLLFFLLEPLKIVD